MPKVAGPSTFIIYELFTGYQWLIKRGGGRGKHPSQSVRQQFPAPVSSVLLVHHPSLLKTSKGYH